MIIKKYSILKVAIIFVFLLSGLLARDIAVPTKIASAATDSCTAPATTYGTDTMTVSVPVNATYTIWTRMMAPSSSANSILLSIDGTNCYNVGGDASMPTGSWTWINYNDGSAANVIKTTLSQGTHTFVLTGTESGVGIDRIEALSDATCTPSGTGDNCTPLPDTTPPTVSITAPANSAAVSGATTINATATDDTGVASVQFKLDGNNLGSADTASPYSFSWDTTTATNGSHTLTAVATDTSGNTATSSSVTVTVNNTASPPPDTTPPTTTISSGPTSSTTATSASFSFAGTDNVTPAGSLTFQCSLDGAAYASCTSPKTYSGLSVGSHTFNVKATDAAGNTDATPAIQAWSITSGTTTPLVGDLDGDGHVTGHDLSIFLAHYNTNYAPAEFDGTTTVEAHDLSLLLSNYGK